MSFFQRTEWLRRQTAWNVKAAVVSFEFLGLAKSEVAKGKNKGKLKFRLVENSGAADPSANVVGVALRLVLAQPHSSQSPYLIPACVLMPDRSIIFTGIAGKGSMTQKLRL